MVKVVKFKVEDRDKRFVLSSTTFSPIGTGTILERLDTYVEDTKQASEKMSMTSPNGGDLQSLYSISTIRDRSMEMLTGIELLKASLDRFVCPEEDVIKKKRQRIIHHGWLERRRNGRKRRNKRKECGTPGCKS